MKGEEPFLKQIDYCTNLMLFCLTPNTVEQQKLLNRLALSHYYVRSTNMNKNSFFLVRVTLTQILSVKLFLNDYRPSSETS